MPLLGMVSVSAPYPALGIYSYRSDFLPKFISMPESNLQTSEDLEQNKVRRLNP
jgi:CMP-2-keto-3-deoxyoctulosonic acid synthetase